MLSSQFFRPAPGLSSPGHRHEANAPAGRRRGRRREGSGSGGRETHLKHRRQQIGASSSGRAASAWGRSAISSAVESSLAGQLIRLRIHQTANASKASVRADEDARLDRLEEPEAAVRVVRGVREDPDVVLGEAHLVEALGRRVRQARRSRRRDRAAVRRDAELSALVEDPGAVQIGAESPARVSSIGFW